ncbi:unnamed protein product [Brassica oleracea]
MESEMEDPPSTLTEVSIQPSGESTDLRDGSSPSSVAELGVLNPVVEVQNRSGTHDEIGGVSNISLVSPPRTISPPLDSTTTAPLPSSAVPEQKTTSDDATTTATPLSRLGAWAKPIKILSPTTHLNLTLQTDGGEVAQIPFKEHWPPLSEQGFRPTRKDVTNMGSLKGIVPGIMKFSDRKEDALSTLFVMHNASTLVDPVTENEDELLSLATLSILENMCMPPSYVCINEIVEQSVPSHETSVDTVPSAQVNSSAVTQSQTEKDKTVEVDLGSNKFASLMSFEEEEDFIDSDKETGPLDLMTPSGKRILRERPVKPSTKAKEMHGQPTSRGRGNRGRGRRGGHG